MAGFKCDLCGGKIKMQANKTGVCQGCGMEYDIEAIRAMAGTVKSAPAVSEPVQRSVVKTANSSDELDRDALITYLNDVRALETVIIISNDRKQKINSKVKTIYNSVSNKNNSFPEPPQQAPVEHIRAKAKANAENIHVAAKESKKTVLITCIIISVSLFVSIMDMDSLVAFILAAIPLVIAFIYVIFKNRETRSNVEFHFRSAEDKIKKQADEMEDYNRNMKNRSAIIAREREYANRQKQEADERLTELDNEISATKQLLTKAYDVNIIPSQFRNIRGVYYLYDYLSTSNQSLSEALMQANLDAMKQKIDKMIQINSLQVIQQYQMNAKLDEANARLDDIGYEMSVANQRLDHIKVLSEQIEENTALAAQYTNIAAVNSQTQTRLAEESLAYQKADYWLNNA